MSHSNPKAFAKRNSAKAELEQRAVHHCVYSATATKNLAVTTSDFAMEYCSQNIGQLPKA
jgi:hypothetical protein